jgi:hypothetical protein
VSIDSLHGAAFAYAGIANRNTIGVHRKMRRTSWMLIAGALSVIGVWTRLGPDQTGL